jgi:hypothetical protein
MFTLITGLEESDYVFLLIPQNPKTPYV